MCACVGKCEGIIECVCVCQRIGDDVRIGVSVLTMEART